MAQQTNRETRPKNKSTEAIIRDVIEQEERVWRAAQARDREAFSKLVPTDGVMIFQSGIVKQPEYLATMNLRTVAHAELKNIRGFMPNSTTAISGRCLNSMSDSGSPMWLFKLPRLRITR